MKPQPYNKEGLRFEENATLPFFSPSVWIVLLNLFDVLLFFVVSNIGLVIMVFTLSIMYYLTSIYLIILIIVVIHNYFIDDRHMDGSSNIN